MLRHFFILVILICASLKDIKTLEIPDYFFVLILLCAKSFGLSNILNFLCVAFVYILLIALVSLLKKEVPIGMGDAKIFASLSFSLGGAALLYIFAAASIFAGIFAAILLLLKRSKDYAFPFCPFILLGYMTFLFRIYFAH